MKKFLAFFNHLTEQIQTLSAIGTNIILIKLKKSIEIETNIEISCLHNCLISTGDFFPVI